MEVKKLQRLQKHLRTLKLFKVVKGRDGCYSMSLQNREDKTRFAMHNWEFDCGMPACVAGHAKYIFNWKDLCSRLGWYGKFQGFFGLNVEETKWIVDGGFYKSKNPTSETATKHIQDVLDGKFRLTEEIK